jgi:hypothetical protein
MSFEIPRYTARTQRTNEMPGKRFDVRKNAEPFIRAELRKGEVQTSLLQQAGEFAAQRLEMLATTEYNNAAVRIEDGMRQALSDFQRDNDVRNIIDGKNKWSQRMKTLRSDVISGIDTPSVRKKIGHQFDLNEVTTRYSLKAVVDKKIIALDALALKSRFDQTRLKLGVLNGSNAAYQKEFQLLEQGYKPGVKNGRYNPETTSQNVLQLKRDIATDVVSEYVTQNPHRAFELMFKLEELADLSMGEIIPDNKTIQLDAGGDYAVFTLANIPAEEAQEILMDAFDQANKLSSFLDGLDEKQDKERIANIKLLKNSYQRLTNAFEPDDVLTMEDMLPAEMQVKEIRDFFEANPQGELTAAEARQMLVNGLYERNGVDEAFQNAIDKDNENKTKSNSEKPRVTEDFALRTLMAASVTGDLTYDLVDQYADQLSQPDFKTFYNIVTAAETAKELEQKGLLTKEAKRVSDTFKAAITLAQSRYQFIELGSDDSAFATSSRAAFFKVKERLVQLQLDSYKEGAEPLTVAKIDEELQAGFKENEQLYFDDVKANFDSYVMTNQSATTITAKGHIFTRSPNMEQELKDWWATLLPSDRANAYLLAEYNRVMSRLRMFMKSGAFDAPTPEQ